MRRTHDIRHPLQVRHGNLACVKALVEGGARLSQRNKQSFTPREDLLKAAPFFAKGRLPKVLRATFEYIECAEVSTYNSLVHELA